jgi:hypothetical protein
MSVDNGDLRDIRLPIQTSRQKLAHSIATPLSTIVHTSAVAAAPGTVPIPVTFDHPPGDPATSHQVDTASHPRLRPNASRHEAAHADENSGHVAAMQLEDELAVIQPDPCGG